MKNIYGGLKIFDNSQLQAGKELRFADSDSSNYVALKAPATVTADLTLTLPAADGTNGQFLKTNGSGVLSWASSLSASLSEFSVLIGNGSSIATAVDTAAQGDIAASPTGLNIKADTIVNADINSAAAIAYSKLNLATSIVNADINASAAIAYSKLNLGSSIVNADVNAAAAIAYSKLNLSGSILNADINASAAIAVTKLAAVTASKALVSDASGFVSPSAVTDVELGYIAGVTSAIQTQVDAKAVKALSNLASVALNVSLIAGSDNAIDLGSSALTFRSAYLKTSLILQETGAGTDAIAISAPAAITTGYSLVLPAAQGSSGQVLINNGSGTLSWANNTLGFAGDWLNADGASLAVVHSLGSKDVIVQIFDKNTDETIEIDSIVRTDTNTVTVTASQAPVSPNGWRVLVSRVA